MNDCHLKSYSNWKIAGILIALLKVIFNIYFGHYFELLLLIVHLPSVYNIVIGEEKPHLIDRFCVVFSF